MAAHAGPWAAHYDQQLRRATARATDEKDLMTPELIDERVQTKIDPEEIMSKPGSLGQERRAESLGFRLSFENSNNQPRIERRRRREYTPRPLKVTLTEKCCMTLHAASRGFASLLDLRTYLHRRTPARGSVGYLRVRSVSVGSGLVRSSRVAARSSCVCGSGWL